MADPLQWLILSRLLVLFFIIHQTWSVSLYIMLNVNTDYGCLQHQVCERNVSNRSWSFIVSPNELFSVGKSVQSIEGNIVLLSTLSSCQLNYVQSQLTDKKKYNMCSVNCSTFFVKHGPVFLQSVHAIVNDTRQSLFDTLSLDNRNWDTIISGIGLILSRKNWKSHIIFTSSHDGLTAISSSIQFTSTQLVLFTIDGRIHMNNTLAIIYSLLGKNDLNFILVCSATCIEEILHQAHQFETMAEKTSNSWLVVPTDRCTGHSNKSMMQVPKADIVVMDFNICTNQYPLLEVDKLQDMLPSSDDGDSSKYPAGFSDYIVQAKNSSSAIANVYKLQTSENGTNIHPVGHITQDGDVAVTENIFPGYNYGFNNRTLIVSTLEWPPFVVKKEENGSVRYSGVCIYLLQELSLALNFSYKIVEPEDREWGRELDGRWTGLIGQLAYKKVDLVTAPIAMLEPREKVMDFTSPYFYVQSGIILKKPDLNTNKWMTLISPFRYEVHICILCSLIFSTVFLFVVEEVNPVNKWTDNKMSARLTRYGDILWYHFGALMADGGPYRPQTQSGRTVLGCWWFFAVISAAIYSGNLIAFLTDWQEKPPFSTLAEMVEQDTYEWGILGGSTYTTLFQDSNRTVYKKIWQGLQDDSDKTSLDTEVHKTKVLEGRYAYLGEETLMEHWGSDRCDLQLLNDHFFLMNYAIGLPNNSAYTSMFSDQVLRINELGLPRVWYKRWKSSVQCETSKSAKRVDLLALQSAFYAAGVGVLLALSVLVTEVIYRKCGQFPSLDSKEMEDETHL